MCACMCVCPPLSTPSYFHDLFPCFAPSLLSLTSSLHWLVSPELLLNEQQSLEKCKAETEQIKGVWCTSRGQVFVVLGVGKGAGAA